MLGWCGRMMRRPLCRWGMIAAASLLFVLVPAIDLTVSGWFYRPGEGFILRYNPWLEWVRKDMPPLLFGLVAVFLLLWPLGLLLKRRLCGVSGRVVAFVLLSLAIGPGLIVNTLLKDNWGRARPSQIEQFGGSAHFSPPFVISDQCRDNCSFASGHGSLGFWVIALALLAPPRWRKPAVGAALGFGVLIGLVRIAQGGHFLSDVLFSGLVSITVSLWLHKKLLAGR